MGKNTKKDNQQAFAIRSVRCCAVCQTPKPDKGRAMDGRRVYRCKTCGNIWTEGMQGRKKKYTKQRDGYQFADSRGYR